MKKTYIITFLLCFAYALHAQINWGIQPNEGIEKNGQYYAIYDDTEYSKVGGGIALTIELNKYKYNIPGSYLTFQTKKDGITEGKLTVRADNEIVTTTSVNNNWTDKVVNQIAPTARELKYEIEKSNGKHYIRNVHLTMASYIDAPVSLNFNKAEIESASETMSFSFDWCNMGTVVVSYEGDPAFKVETGSLNTAGKYGTAKVNVTYTHENAGDHTGIITITNGINTHTLQLTGTTYKHYTTLTWKDNISPIQVSTILTDVATASHGGRITYTSSHPDIVRVEDNRLIAVAPGNATITASHPGNDRWSAIEESKQIIVTAQQTQYIHWAQSFLRLTTEMPDILLQAQSYATDTETPTGFPVTYSVSDESVATILTQTDAEGYTLHYLHILSVGTATLTASCAGNDNFAPAEDIINTIIVRLPSEGCNPLVYEQTETTQLRTNNSGPEILLKGEPGYITFDAQNSKWGVISASGNMVLCQLVGEEWLEVWKDPLEENKWNSYGPIPLDRNATRIQFRMKNGICYHTYTNVAVTLAKYLEADVEALHFADVTTGAPVLQSFSVKYSNIPDVLFVDIVGEDKGFFYISQEQASIGDNCGDKGKTSLDIYFLPTAERTYNATLRIADKNNKMVLEIPLSGNAVATQLPVKEWTLFSPCDDHTCDYTYDVAKLQHRRLIYILDGNNYANLNIRSGDAITFEQEENVLLPIEADRWRTIVPPFDVHAVYLVELVPDNVLSSLSRTEAIAVQQEANRQLYAWLAQHTDEANQNTAETRTLLDLIEEYITYLRTTNQYADDAIGLYSLEQYNGANPISANYFAYNAGDAQWELNDGTSLGVQNEWTVETSTRPLMHKAQVYALNFPYCIDCDPATGDDYDYWSGKCIILHGEGGQAIEGSGVHLSILNKAETLGVGKVLFTGNHTLSALPLTDGKAYIHQTDPKAEYYDCYVRQTADMMLPPLSSVLFAKDNDFAGRTLRAVSRCGQAWYDTTDVTTALPTIAAGASLMAIVQHGGIVLQAKTPTAVSVYTVSGILLWQGVVDTAEQLLHLPCEGLYLLQTPTHTDKILVP